MAIFNSYVKLPEGRDCSAENDDQPWDLDFHMTPIFHASPVADDTSAVPPPPRIDSSGWSSAHLVRVQVSWNSESMGNGMNGAKPWVPSGKLT